MYIVAGSNSYWNMNKTGRDTGYFLHLKSSNGVYDIWGFLQALKKNIAQI
jgi:hypothetical protein